MNANELPADQLADLLDEIPVGDFESLDHHHFTRQAATLLRQQAKELDEAGHIIGVLREYISDLENGLESSIKLNKAQAERASMNNIPHIVDTGASVMRNEPVAYVNSMCNDYIDWKIDPMSIDGQSLYTHPVKELTDEVIEQVRVAIMGAAYWCADENMPEAYNAVKVCCGQVLGILVKAQEK
jgi:hypothetical protein